MRTLEFLLFFFVVISVLMCYAGIPGGPYVFTTASILLGTFYLLIGSGLLRGSFIGRLRQVPPEERAGIVMQMLAGVVFAFAVLAMLFNEQLWQSRTVLLFTAIGFLTVLIFLSLIFLEKNEPQLHRYIFIHFWLASIILLFYVIVPLTTRLEWKYEDQYYREILQYALEHPEDQEARKTVTDYERRLQGLSIDEELQEP